MGFFPVFGGGGTGVNNGANNATSYGVAMVNSGVAHTKGNYTQIVASTTRNVSGILVVIGHVDTVNHDFAVDIAIGAAASEKIIAANLLACCNAFVGLGSHYVLPISIPAGTRIAARMQSSSTTALCNVTVQEIVGGLHTPSYGAVDAIGVTVSGDTTGTAFSHPGANNTKGSYVQYVASTTRRYKGLMVQCGHRQANASQIWLHDIAIGGAGSEKIIIPNINWMQSTTSDSPQQFCQGPFMVDIPAGTRIAGRIQIDTTGSGRDFWSALYGIA